MKNKTKVPEVRVKSQTIVHDADYQRIVAIIDKEVDYIDIKPFSHNIIGLALGEAAKKFSDAAANDLIEEFGLEGLGWSKHNDRDEVD